MMAPLTKITLEGRVWGRDEVITDRDKEGEKTWRSGCGGGIGSQGWRRRSRQGDDKIQELQPVWTVREYSFKKEWFLCLLYSHDNGLSPLNK